MEALSSTFAGDVCDDSDFDGMNDNLDTCPLDPDNDIDGDGVCGDVDNCPSDPNPGQADADDDGFGDACDELADVAPEKGGGKGGPGGGGSCKNDTDCDGLSDTDEATFGTDPNNPDSDGDSIKDGPDNCKLSSNSSQTNTDNDSLGDACDDDDDGDTVPDTTDNCPLTPNADQANLDNDSAGDLCDDDRDNDGLTNTEEVALGTSPTNPDTDADEICDGPGNTESGGINCGGLTEFNDPTPLGEVYTIVFEARDATEANVINTWLPSAYPAAPESVDDDGDSITDWVQTSSITIVAMLKNPSGDIVPFDGDVSFSLSTSHWEGVATNATEVSPFSNDYSFDSIDKTDLSETDSTAGGSTEATVELYSFDYGGQATITATTTLTDSTVVVGTVDLPLDSDNDLLPNVWEITRPSAAGFNAFNANSFSTSLDDGLEDIDTSLGNTFIGDGLTNFREYRGILLEIVSSCAVTGTYHERLDPTHKDLFVRGVDYANSCPPSTAPDVLNFSVNVTGGSAFEEAGIDVHDVTRMPSFSGTIEPPHIDILVVTNDTTNTTTLEGYADGYQNHLGTRYWTWDTKGASFIGTPILYNFNSITEKQGTYTYHLNLMHYFYNHGLYRFT
jgi:hypothetical protein